MAMDIDLEKFDIKRFAETLVREGNEGIKWEIRKLQWIREEKAKEVEAESEAA